MTPDLVMLVELETAVWQALVTGDAAADRALLSEQFLGVYPSGFAGREDHVAQLESGPSVRSFEITDARVVPVAGDAALLSYLAVFERRGTDACSEQMFVTSLWQHIDGSWLNTFSQDTRCDTADA